MKTSAIKPLTDFVRNTKSHIAHLKETQEPEILTVNGEAVVVVQNAESYQEMAELAEQARQDAKLQTALHYFRNGGKGIKAENVFRLSPEEQDEAIAFLDKWSEKPPLGEKSDSRLDEDERAEAIWEKYTRA